MPLGRGVRQQILYYEPIRIDPHPLELFLPAQMPPNPTLPFSETPQIDVSIVEQNDLPSVGAGEGAQGPTSAAIANAVHNALGVRVRNLPLTSDEVTRAM